MKEKRQDPKIMPVCREEIMDVGTMLRLGFIAAAFTIIVVFAICEESKNLREFKAELIFVLLIIQFLATWFLRFINSREIRLNDLLNESTKALKVSSDYLHGHGVIKNHEIAEAHYNKALSGFKKVAQCSRSYDHCLYCAVSLDELADPEGFCANPDSKFRDVSFVAATYLRAAILGSRPSQLKVAQLYQEGAGFARDLTEAYAWFNICAAHGNVEAERSRESLAASMSQAEIAKAQQRSQELFAMVNGRN